MPLTRSAALLFCITPLLLGAVPAAANIITVTSLADNLTVDGQVTLREAIEAAVTDTSVDGSAAGNGHDRIIFHAAVPSGSVVPWTQGQYIIFSGGDFTIDPVFQADGIIIDCGGNSRFLRAQGSPDLTFRNLTITGGQSPAADPDGGAVYLFGGQATFEGCTLAGNAAPGSGGAVFATSAPTVRFYDGTVTGNTADLNGGGVFFSSGAGDSLIVSGTRIVHNTASMGGGIYLADGFATFTDAGVDSNTASSTTTVSSIGGAVYSEGELELVRTSVTGNQAVPGASTAGFSGGVYLVGADAEVTDCLFSLNSASTNTSGCSLYNAYASSGSGTVTVTGTDFIGNTGGSGAAIANSGQMTLVGCLIEGNDAGLGSAVANAIGTPVMVMTSCILRGNLGEDGAALDNAASATMTLTDCLLENNTSSDDGGALLNLGTLTIDLCTFRSNFATSGDGGALAHLAGTMTLTNTTFDANQALRGGGMFTKNLSGGSSRTESCTFKDNLAINDGGAIYIYGDAELYQTTISGNTAGQYGGGIHHGDGFPANSGDATVNQCTIVGNTANLEGGGVLKLAPMYVGGTIVSGNTANSATADFDITRPGAAGSPLYSLGYNLIGETSAVTWTATDQTGILDPVVGPLQDNGGPTETRALQFGSPALDRSNIAIYATFPNDQRGTGFPRAIDGTQLGTAVGDVGAFEFDPACTQVVASLEDTYAPGRLRYEIACAAPGDTLVFDPSLAGGTFLMIDGQLTLDKDLVLDGTGLGITLDAQGASRVLEVLGGASVELLGFTLTGGLEADGGGVMNFGELDLRQCIVTGNQATDTGGGVATYGGGTLVLYESVVSANNATNSGGGVYSNGPASATVVTLSTITGNSATLGGGAFNTSGSNLSISQSEVTANEAGSGGGIYNNQLDGSSVSMLRSTVADNSATSGSGGGLYTTGGATITLSTFAGNSAAGHGGGIDYFGTFLNLRLCTLSGNSADDGGGLYVASGSPFIESVIIGGNTATTGDADVQVALTAGVSSGGYNLVGETNGATYFNQTGDMTGVPDPRLGPLEDNGGPTRTMALLLGSAALDAGDPTACATYTEDQRYTGFPRAFDGDGDGATVCDIGAFESDLLELGVPIQQEDVAVILRFNYFTGSGFTPDPVLGQLDSDGVVVRGVSDETVPMRFGDTAVAGDYARGQTTGGVSVGGVFAFEPNGTTALGFSPTATDFTPGSFTLGYRNLTGVPLTSVAIAYDLFVFNGGDRANGVIAAYAVSAAEEIDPAALAFSNVPGSAFSSPEPADPVPDWVGNSFLFNVGGLAVPAGGYLYLNFTCTDLPGSNTGRDDFALDDLAVTANPSGLSDVEVPVAFAGPFRLGQVHPNPFNPRASFDLEVKRDQRVTVTVYDVAGRAVRVLHDGILASGGVRTFTLDGGGLGSGVYFVRAVGEDFTAVRKAVMLK